MKKGFKVAVSLLLMLSMLFALSGCGEEKQAQKAFEGLMSSLKALDFEQAQQYADLETATIGDGESLTGEAKIFMENLFDKLEWEVLSVTKVDDENVQIKANITAADMTPILSEFFQKALEYAFSGALSSAQMSEEETNAKLAEILKEVVSKAGLATINTEVTVQVTRVDDGWRVALDEAFVDALLGGMNAAVSALENAFGAE